MVLIPRASRLAALLLLLVASVATSVGPAGAASQYCDDETYNGEHFAQRVLQRPTNRLLVKTEGSATSKVPEIQEVQLWSHQVIDLTVGGKNLTGGKYKLEFCTFDVQLPGTVIFAPLPGDGSDDLIMVSTTEQNVASAWEEFGVYSGYPIRISTDQTTATQDRRMYRIYYTECDNCDGYVMQLDRNYEGTKIRGGAGAAWGCSWDLPSTDLAYNAGETAVKNAFESALGSGAVESVTRTAVDEALGQGFVYRVVLAKGVVGVHARLDATNLRGEDIDTYATEIVRGADTDATFADETSRTTLTGDFTLAFEGDETTSLAITATALEVKNALMALSGIGPDIAVSKQDDGWSWLVTFQEDDGDVDALATAVSSASTPGLTLKVETTRVGLTTLDGEFELTLGSTGESIRVPAAASSNNLRSLLEDSLGLSDVSVTRTGPSASNGYEWELELAGDCPDNFDPDSDELSVAPVCSVDLVPGAQTASLLLGNDATLTVTSLVVASLASAWGGETVTWQEASRTPASLPASELKDGQYYLPVGTSERGRYVFEAVSASDSSVVVGTQLVYVDAAPPVVDVGDTIAVSYPTDWVDISGNASQARFGSTIASYAWTLKSKPASATASAGQVQYPSAETTTVTSLNVPGSFQYQLRIADSLGLVSCAVKNVKVLFAPGIDNPLQDLDLVPGEDLVLNCSTSGSTPLSYTWMFGNVVLDVPTTTSVLVLPDVAETDQGNYQCSVENEVTAVQSNSAYVNVYDPVEITANPASTITAPGKTAKLSCAATASFPVDVTWQRRPLGEAVWTTYSTQRVASGTEGVSTAFPVAIEDTSEEDEGEYRCVVSNIAGNASSASAALEVLDLPSNVVLTVTPESVLEDGVDEGGSGSFKLACTAEGQNLTYAFARNGAVVKTNVQSLFVQNVTAARDGGDYTCVVTNGAGSVESNVIEIVVNTPPIIIEQPESIVAKPGQEVVLTVRAIGATPLSYIWKKDGQYLSEEALAVRNLTFASVKEEDEGTYSVVVYNNLGHAESTKVTLEVEDPPKIVVPATATQIALDPGETATLRCEANGTGELTFMWFEDLTAGASNLTRVVRGRETSGANWTQLILQAVDDDDEHAYHCKALSDLGEAISPAITISVNDAPSITLDPVDTFAEPGSTVAMRVVAAGAEPLLYQWRKHGVPVPGGISSTLTLGNVSASDEGVYDCRVTNHLSPITGALSATGELRLAKAPEIITEPAARTAVDPTKTTSLRCAFSGAPPMNYSWVYRREGAEDLVVQQNETLAAYVDSTLDITAAEEADQGTYVLIAENRLGAVSSQDALLSVNDPPIITTERVSVLVDPGDNVSFACSVTADPQVTAVTWKRRPASGSSGDVILSGQTGLTLGLSSVQQADEGRYVCLAANSAGSAEKVVGVLDVRDPPTIVSMSPVAEGGVISVDPLQSITLSVVATGLAPLTYAWTLDGEVVQTGSSSEFTFVPKDAGYVFVRVTNQLGFDVSTPTTIAINAPAQIDEVSIVPENGRIVPGATAELLCRASGSTPLTIDWLKDGEVIDPTVDPVGDDALENSTDVPRFVVREDDAYSSTLLALDAAVATHSGTVQCRARNSANPAGALSSALALTVVVAPVLRPAAPEDITRLPGTNSSFQCDTSAGTGPFAVRWFYAETLGTNVEEVAVWNSSRFEDAIGAYQESARADNLVLVIPDASDEDEGLFSCEVCNEGGCARSRWASLGVADSPRIVEQIPSAENSSLVANPGDEVILSVVASGLEPLGFQWYKYAEDTDSMVLVETGGEAYRLEPEECSAAGQPCKLIMDDVANAQAGSYHCVVSNTLGETSSVMAHLTVTEKPSLADASSWPGNLVTACPGNVFEQRVELSGTLPMHIKWYFSSTVAGASSIFTTKPVWETTDAVFQLSDPAFSDEGYYAFIATNVAGELRSSVARLEVNEGPSAAADASGPSPRHPVTLPQTFTRLYGTASTNAISYAWELLSHPELGSGKVQILSPTAASTDVVGLTVAGAYVFQLTVTGSNGCYSEDTVSVTVNTAPVPVVANATVGLAQGDAWLDGSASYDIDAHGAIAKYAWALASVDGSVERAETVALLHNETSAVALAEPAVGLYEFLLTVTDNDGASRSKRAFLNVLDISFVSPVAPFAAPFIAGDCFEHLVVVSILGALPEGGDTFFGLAFVSEGEAAPLPAIAGSSLRNLETASLTAHGAHVSLGWAVEPRVPQGPGHLVVTVGQDAQTETLSGVLTVELAHRFVAVDEGECNCGETPTRSQSFQCLGYGHDGVVASLEETSCAWVEIEHETSVCERLAPMPTSESPCTQTQIEACSNAVRWHVGAWSAGSTLDEEAFCASQPCGTSRTREVYCANAAGEQIDGSKCAAPGPSATQTCDIAAVSCLQSQLQRAQGAFSTDGDAACSAVWHRGAPSLCFDAQSGFLLGETSCAGDSSEPVDSSAALCAKAWATSAWVCDRESNLAQRNVTCVNSSSGSQADGCSSAAKPLSSRACVASGSEAENGRQLVSSDGWFYWSVGSWGACAPGGASKRSASATCEATQRERQVFCLNRQREVASDAKCAQLTKPRTVEACASTCEAACDATCGPHGRCSDATLSSCTCDLGWTGDACDTPSATTCNGESEIWTTDDECCDLSVAALDSSGICCSSGVLDREGACCASGTIDACGVCDGEGVAVDVLGACCASVLDAEGTCCASGELDRCGVCEGTGHSCVAHVDLTGSLSWTGLGGAPLGEAQTRLLAGQALSNVLTTEVPAASTWTLLSTAAIDAGGRRRALQTSANASAIEIIASLEVAASAAFSWEQLESAEVWSALLGAVFNASTAEVYAVGVCGNGICEAGERCTAPGCCPTDCVVPDAALWCPSGCSSHGICLPGQGRCDCFPGYGGENCSTCTGGARETSQGDCLPLAWVPEADEASEDTSGSGQEPAVETVVVRRVQVLWPGFLVGLILSCALLACAGAFVRRRDKRLRKEADLRRQRNIFAGPEKHDLERGDHGRPASERGRGRGGLGGWLWKRSRNGYNGQQIWQQWYASKQDLELYYYDCDTDEAWSKAGAGQPQERGKINLAHVEAVLVKGRKSFKHGGWRFDLVMRAPALAGDAGSEASVSTKSPRDGIEEGQDHETVDVLDYPQVRSRDLGEVAEAMPRTRLEFMCDARHDAHAWAEAIAKSAGASLQYGRGSSGSSMGLKPSKEERVVIDLASVASFSASSTSSFAGSVAGPSMEIVPETTSCASHAMAPGSAASTAASPSTSSVSSSSTRSSRAADAAGKDLVIGSFSGAVGERVGCEGWIRLENDERNVYGVLFSGRDELAVFARMAPARDGAHHYADKLHSFSMSHVTGVGSSKLSAKSSKLIELRFWDGTRFAFAVSSRATWRTALQRHLQFRHGIDVDEEHRGRDDVSVDEEHRERDEASVPESPAQRSLYAVNEPLSSLKVRRSSSVASLKPATSLARPVSARKPSAGSGKNSSSIRSSSNNNNHNSDSEESDGGMLGAIEMQIV